MQKYIFSDLVMENATIENIRQKSICREEYNCEWKNGIEICRLNIENSVESKKYACAIGSYVTIYTDRLDRYDISEVDILSDIVADEIRSIVKRTCELQSQDNISVLIVGMGNRGITPDALGARTVELVRVTRHMQKLAPACNDQSHSNVIAAMPCGVFGETGIESLELIKGVVRQISPQLLIAVDSLAAKSSTRLASVIQLSNVGIAPGAGVGNKRSEINQKTLGIPVIAIGIPTVISAATLVADTLCCAGIQNVDKKTRKALEKYADLFVAPKECDLIIDSSAELLARSVEKAFL